MKIIKRTEGPMDSTKKRISDLENQNGSVTEALIVIQELFDLHSQRMDQFEEILGLIHTYVKKQILINELPGETEKIN